MAIQTVNDLDSEGTEVTLTPRRPHRRRRTSTEPSKRTEDREETLSMSMMKRSDLEMFRDQMTGA